MNFKPYFRELAFDDLQPILQLLVVVADKHHVIHVPRIILYPEPFFDKVIQRIKQRDPGDLNDLAPWVKPNVSRKPVKDISSPFSFILWQFSGKHFFDHIVPH